MPRRYAPTLSRNKRALALRPPPASSRRWRQRSRPSGSTEYSLGRWRYGEGKSAFAFTLGASRRGILWTFRSNQEHGIFRTRGIRVANRQDEESAGERHVRAGALRHPRV